MDCGAKASIVLPNSICPLFQPLYISLSISIFSILIFCLLLCLYLYLVSFECKISLLLTETILVRLPLLVVGEPDLQIFTKAA